MPKWGIDLCHLPHATLLVYCRIRCSDIILAMLMKMLLLLEHELLTYPLAYHLVPALNSNININPVYFVPGSSVFVRITIFKYNCIHTGNPEIRKASPPKQMRTVNMIIDEYTQNWLNYRKQILHNSSFYLTIHSDHRKANSGDSISVAFIHSWIVFYTKYFMRTRVH